MNGSVSRDRLRRLNAHQLALLRQIVVRRRPALASLVDHLGERPLSQDEREEIREVLLEELLETGLLDDDEPNARGIEIDDLIGKLAWY